MPTVHTETNKSPLYCKYCKNHLTKYQESKVMTSLSFNCPTCATDRYEFEVGVKVLPSSAKHMMITGVRDSVWYHSTHRPDWWYKKETYDNPIYIGTYNAAKRRWRDCASSAAYADSPFWMYKLRLNPKVKIHPRVLVDDYLDSDTADKASDKAVRFVNIFESPGSISLALPGDFVQIIECKELT